MVISTKINQMWSVTLGIWECQFTFFHWKLYNELFFFNFKNCQFNGILQ